MHELAMIRAVVFVEISECSEVQFIHVPSIFFFFLFCQFLKFFLLFFSPWLWLQYFLELLKPHVHYIPVAKDFSDLAEKLAAAIAVKSRGPND